MQKQDVSHEGFNKMSSTKRLETKNPVCIVENNILIVVLENKFVAPLIIHNGYNK